tara:strand:+ start:23920 stop:25218 length:1299 start_codon:yes stop_codon:yes gene_type:complete
MQTFTSYLTEGSLKQQQQELKSYIKRSLEGVKFTESSRGAYHVRFPLAGSDAEVAKLLKKYNLKIVEYNRAPISSKFPTVVLKLTKTISPKLPLNTEIPWVNNSSTAAVSGAQIFGNKDLTPDSLGLAGKTLTTAEIMAAIKPKLEMKYTPDVVKELMDMAFAARTKSSKIKYSNSFSTKDLAKVSADFGEILSAIWAQANLGFKAAYFPKASNAALIDFYGMRFGVPYPISVKSGGGGKVTVQNIIDAINNRTKTATASDLANEPSLAIFKIVNDMPMKDQMIELHKYMDTEAIRKLAGIMGVRVANITLNSVLDFVGKFEDQKDLVTSLEPFWKAQSTVLTARTKEGDDRLRLVLSPLGESIWKILNADKEIQDSLTRIARQVVLIQINVDVTKSQIGFKNNQFKDADFQFGWAGYAAKNKLGFKMKVKG